MAKNAKRSRRKLTPEDVLKREQKRFRGKIRGVFEKAGFKSIATREQEIDFKGKKSELDFLFVIDNVIVIAEDTCSKKSESIRNHLLKKNLFYRHVIEKREEFVDFLKEQFPELANFVRQEYDSSDIKLIFAYCTKYRLEDQYKKPFGDIHFFEDRHLEYFSSLSKTLGKTMRYEIFKFLELEAEDLMVGAGASSRYYDGFILPESPSGFPKGYKVVTFYVDPSALLAMAYVLRKDGWVDGDGLYQRMISRNKIRSMRQYLANEDRVFINNVIVSLPATTKILDAKTKKQIEPGEITKTTPIAVEFPFKFNSIGIIDGQHRVFAYHEGTDAYEARIAPKRIRQQLLVTGIVYPDAAIEELQREFEARLFLEINDKQTRTRADLRQVIEAIVNPFSVIAISRSIISKLAADSPLCGYLEEHQFDKGKLKSSSIVSYGLKHIVKCEETGTLFSLWKNPEKIKFSEAVNVATQGKRSMEELDKKILDNYIEFCATQIKYILIAYKLKVPSELWTLDRKQSRALSTTAINGLIFLLKKLLEEKRTMSLAGYQQAFSKLSIQFTPSGFKFKSSHWRELGLKIYKDCFT